MGAIVLAVFAALKGMPDLVSPETDRRRALVDAFATAAGRAGYREVQSPLLEDLGVFLRVGEATDVVTKEMYDFVDKDGTRIALRPEFTASLMRMFVEHPPATLPWKVWTTGPAFRHENPQAGRYRQFFQLDLEAVGAADPDVDVEVIAVAHDFFRSLGLTQVSLKLNSLGDESSRAPFMAALRAHFDANRDGLSEQSRITLEKNPLRVLDSKRDYDQSVIEAAPRMTEFLSAHTAAHFERVQRGLRAVGIAFTLESRLVRGMDYYTHTLFEFVADALVSSQNAIGGGGHYDNLVEQLGGPSTPGIGFGLGIDRILLACDAEGVFGPPLRMVAVFVVDTTGGSSAVALTHELRRAGIGAERSFDGRSMKAQFKAADRSGAAIALVVGSDEEAAGTVVVRDLRASDQVVVPRAGVLAEVQRRLTH